MDGFYEVGPLVQKLLGALVCHGNVGVLVYNELALHLAFHLLLDERLILGLKNVQWML